MPNYHKSCNTSMDIVYYPISNYPDIRKDHSVRSFLKCDKVNAEKIESFNKNKAWMYNIDKMDNDNGKADGWLKADILYREFPGLSKEIKGVRTKFDGVSVFFNSEEMAAYITQKYNSSK